MEASPSVPRLFFFPSGADFTPLCWISQFWRSCRKVILWWIQAVFTVTADSLSWSFINPRLYLALHFHRDPWENICPCWCRPVSQVSPEAGRLSSPEHGVVQLIVLFSLCCVFTDDTFKLFNISTQTFSSSSPSNTSRHPTPAATSCWWEGAQEGAWLLLLLLLPPEIKLVRCSVVFFSLMCISSFVVLEQINKNINQQTPQKLIKVIKITDRKQSDKMNKASQEFIFLWFIQSLFKLCNFKVVLDYQRI